MRFKADCEKNGMGKKLKPYKIKVYESHLDVVLSTRYVNGAGGARCTKELKRMFVLTLRNQQNSGKVWGYEYKASGD